MGSSWKIRKRPMEIIGLTGDPRRSIFAIFVSTSSSSSELRFYCPCNELALHYIWRLKYAKVASIGRIRNQFAQKSPQWIKCVRYAGNEAVHLAVKWRSRWIQCHFSRDAPVATQNVGQRRTIFSMGGHRSGGQNAHCGYFRNSLVGESWGYKTPLGTFHSNCLNDMLASQDFRSSCFSFETLWRPKILWYSTKIPLFGAVDFLRTH